MSQGQSMLDINRRDLQVWSEHQSGHFWPQVGHNHSIFCTLLTIWAVFFVNMTFYDIFSQITHIFWIDGNHSSAFLIDSFPENVPFLYRWWWVLNHQETRSTSTQIHMCNFQIQKYELIVRNLFAILWHHLISN